MSTKLGLVHYDLLDRGPLEIFLHLTPGIQNAFKTQIPLYTHSHLPPQGILMHKAPHVIAASMRCKRDWNNDVSGLLWPNLDIIWCRTLNYRTLYFKQLSLTVETSRFPVCHFGRNSKLGTRYIDNEDLFLQRNYQRWPWSWAPVIMYIPYGYAGTYKSWIQQVIDARIRCPVIAYKTKLQITTGSDMYTKGNVLNIWAEQN